MRIAIEAGVRRVVGSGVMARKEVEEFLRDCPREPALAFMSLLEDEIPGQDSLAIVRCGGIPSLLRYTEAGDVLRFYFVQESESEDTLPRLERIQIATPRGAEVKLIGQLERPRPTAMWEDWTVRRTIVVTHRTLPHGEIAYDLDSPDSEHERQQVDQLFSSWVKPAT